MCQLRNMSPIGQGVDASGCFECTAAVVSYQTYPNGFVLFCSGTVQVSLDVECGMQNLNC